MMNDLAHKAVNEKYFKSIRYFSHLLKGERRSSMIYELSNYNIYLAAQCLMSSERNPTLESELKIKSELFAREFENIDKSAKGFLALAEFESFEIILSLLTSISKPNKIHQQVFNTILSESDSNMFLNFLEVILKANKPELITFLISAFNKEIVVSLENKIKLRNIIRYFLDHNLSGILRLFLTKFELLTDLAFIFDTNISGVIDELVYLKSHKIIKLCYNLVSINYMFDRYSPTFFVEALSKNDNINAIKSAIQISVLHKLEPNQDLDSIIIKYTSPATSLKSLRNKSKKLKILIKSGLLVYAKNNPSILARIENFISTNMALLNTSDEFNDVYYYRLHSEIELTYFFNSCDSLIDLFDKYFENTVIKRAIKIEAVIKIGLNKFNASLMEISHILRKYEFTGEIRHKQDFGCYIHTKELNTEKLPFIHRTQIFEPNSSKNYSNLSDGESIKFRIIGINKDTLRLNSSALREYKI
jgi:hypothetical protein